VQINYDLYDEIGKSAFLSSLCTWNLLELEFEFSTRTKKCFQNQSVAEN
jgi:hypothetical protein